MLENLQAWFQRYFVDNGATSWWLEGLKTTVLVTLLAFVSVWCWDFSLPLSVPLMSRQES